MPYFNRYNPAMSGIEWKAISPEEMIQHIERSVKLYRENKYAFQTGLKDLDFDVNKDQLEILGIVLPFENIGQAELALQNHGIQPSKFIEDDNTEHQVLVFDHRPIGYSGFMDCVTHSLALTSHGLFEVGRYPAVSLNKPGRYWQWFLHRRLASVDEVQDWNEDRNLSPEQFVQDIYQLLTKG